MNKDLAAVTAVWRVLFGVHGGRFCCFICVLVVLLSKNRRRWFAADDGSVSGDGHRFSMLYCRWIIARLGLCVCDSRTGKMWRKRV